MLAKVGVAAAALGLAAVSLQGCGGSSTPTVTTTTTLLTTTTEPAPAPVTTTTTMKPPPQPFIPVRGISYHAKPYKQSPTILPGPDMMQEGFLPQFHTVRDDLGIIRSMGASSVRVYAGIGSEIYSDHSAFLNRAEDLGLHVIVDFYTPGLCEEFDCFDQWKKGALNALNSQGFKKDGKWHPAIKMLMLMHEPDNLPFSTSTGAPPDCPPDASGKQAAWCRVKGVLSAFDGLLAAEKDAGVDGKNVSVGVAWSFVPRTSLDGTDVAELYGFQDMTVGIASPKDAKYVFKSEGYQEAYASRWVHAMNTAANWKFTKEKLLDKYTQFNDNKLLLSQMTPADTQGDQDLAEDLKAIEAEAKKGGSFIGVVVRGFQTDYDDATAFKFMFNLGDEKLAQDMNICNEDPRTPETKTCNPFPLYCLDPTNGRHSGDVATAWGGTVDPAAKGLCKPKADALVQI